MSLKVLEVYTGAQSKRHGWVRLEKDENSVTMATEVVHSPSLPRVKCETIKQLSNTKKKADMARLAFHILTVLLSCDGSSIPVRYRGGQIKV